eukprot:TRINITY_DN112_c0_g1_i1.p1 TRINITY_DN112_c0_g1~~TRINITY_DN112_c0_g1_i1.p1  ORF type:complete len:901 (-),score=197.88 TRINITY_DN112_c0_g1_i1:167-2869(-)
MAGVVREPEDASFSGLLAEISPVVAEVTAADLPDNLDVSSVTDSMEHSGLPDTCPPGGGSSNSNNNKKLNAEAQAFVPSIAPMIAIAGAGVVPDSSQQQQQGSSRPPFMYAPNQRPPPIHNPPLLVGHPQHLVHSASAPSFPFSFANSSVSVLPRGLSPNPMAGQGMHRVPSDPFLSPGLMSAQYQQIMQQQAMILHMQQQQLQHQHQQQQQHVQTRSLQRPPYMQNQNQRHSHPPVLSSNPNLPMSSNSARPPSSIGNPFPNALLNAATPVHNVGPPQNRTPQKPGNDARTHSQPASSSATSVFPSPHRPATTSPLSNGGGALPPGILPLRILPGLIGNAAANTSAATSKQGKFVSKAGKGKAAVTAPSSNSAATLAASSASAASAAALAAASAAAAAAASPRRAVQSDSEDSELSGGAEPRGSSPAGALADLLNDAERSALGTSSVGAAKATSSAGATMKSAELTELKEKLARQVEFYFSDQNLPTDNFLMKHVKKDSEGFVPISVVGTFRKVRSLLPRNAAQQQNGVTSSGIALVASALRLSSELVVSDDGKRVRRRTPLPDMDLEEVYGRTVVAENLPAEHSVEAMEKLFSAVGKVKMVRVCQPKAANSANQTKQMLVSNKLHALVEFETVEEAERAVANLTDASNWRSGLHVRFLGKHAGRGYQSNGQGNAGKQQQQHGKNAKEAAATAAAGGASGRGEGADAEFDEGEAGDGQARENGNGRRSQGAGSSDGSSSENAIPGGKGSRKGDGQHRGSPHNRGGLSEDFQTSGRSPPSGGGGSGRGQGRGGQGRGQGQGRGGGRRSQPSGIGSSGGSGGQNGGLGGHRSGTPPHGSPLQNAMGMGTSPSSGGGIGEVMMMNGAHQQQSRPPPGPRMPDGTRGFSFGRGKKMATVPVST